MNDELYKKFCSITPALDDKFIQVLDISATLPHKLGCTLEYYPIFFIECADEIPTTNINLKQISVSFNQVCNLKGDNDNSISKKYSIVMLKSTESDLQKYFLDMVYIVLNKLPHHPSVKALKHEIMKVVSLFSTPPVFSKEVVQGLWAELLVINQSSNPLYLINSWHVSPEDKFDFNDGVDKIEVKATQNQERVHSFAIEQLNPNKDSKLLVASIIVTPSGQGPNIFDLISSILTKITDVDAQLKLQEIAFETIGPNLEAVRKVRFDLGMAINTYKLFHHYDVPSIALSNVPVEVSKVHFSSCLKNTNEADLSIISSKLHLAL